MRLGKGFEAPWKTWRVSALNRMFFPLFRNPLSSRFLGRDFLWGFFWGELLLCMFPLRMGQAPSICWIPCCGGLGQAAWVINVCFEIPAPGHRARWVGRRAAASPGRSAGPRPPLRLPGWRVPGTPGRSPSQGGGLALEPGHDPAGAVMCPWCLLVTCVCFDTLLTLLTVCLCDRCVGALDLQLGNRAAQRRGVGNAWQVLLARWPG